METFTGIVLSIILFVGGHYLNQTLIEKWLDPRVKLDYRDIVVGIFGFILSAASGSLFVYTLII